VIDVRAATAGDLPAVAELLMRVEPRAPDVESAERRLAEALLGNPWRDAALPSLVAADEAGKVRAFLGVIPRPMIIGTRAVRAAAGVRLVVDPTCRAFVGHRLLRRFLEGPQELSLVDGGGCATRMVWERLGGFTPVAYAVSWTRPIRPAALAARRLGGRLGAAIAAAAPITGLVDRCLARARATPFALPAAAPAGREVDDGELAACLGRLRGGRGLHARYDARTLGWLLAQAGARTGGVLRRIVVPGRRGEAGAYVLVTRAGEVAQVLAMAYHQLEGDTVLRDALLRARDAGCVAVSGRADLRLVIDLTDRGCLLHATRTHTLLHARDPELAKQVEAGSAWLDRLDGDWWLPV
jgi:hypothetical protein